ncbi:MAG: FKBP-type peptidyl-prolyl cis-trans isomerase [Planctomycetes bacterium]|nr:FKBP-type peptidyl-prolyl cis-trans isomerase [Planctomycetota bacterium]
MELGDGLRYQELVLGTGPEVEPGATVLTHATGTFTDGAKFWSSIDDGKKVAFPLRDGSVIPGWVRGVPGMKVGGKRKLYIPWQLAYGEGGRPPTIPPKADLVFEIEVFEIQ